MTLLSSDAEKLSSDAENGEKIIEIYSDLNVKPGETLISNNFAAWAGRNRILPRDIDSGLEFAIREGWITEQSDGSLALTEAGFRKM